MKGRKVEILKDANGKMKVFLGDIELKTESLGNTKSRLEDLNRKDVLDWKPKSQYIPDNRRPWKKYVYQKRREDELRKEMKRYHEIML